MLSLFSAAQDLWQHLGPHLVVLADPNEYNPDQSAVPEDLKRQVRKLLGLVAWTVTGCCVAGVLFVAGKLAINHSRGEGAQHLAGLGYVGLACVLGSTAGPLVMAIF